MELREAMTTLGTCRRFRPDPLPDEVLVRAVEMARYAASGGNRQPVRYLVVRDAAARRRLGEWYLEPWGAYYERARAGGHRVGGEQAARMLEEANAFAHGYGDHPAIVVVCARLADLLATDADLDRLSIVGGASVYPAVQNFLLALRSQGVATAMTTLLCGAHDERVRELLGIPDGWATACHVVAGYPERPFPRRLTRLPVSELLFAERFGAPLEGPA
ncbi:MAG TPA: nitroreductase family protein [Solirubrobacter sp.]|jgi:nitroreductase|nr:nitroreductase family protein [Solirubrobacter sp.]